MREILFEGESLLILLAKRKKPSCENWFEYLKEDSIPSLLLDWRAECLLCNEIIDCKNSFLYDRILREHGINHLQNLDLKAFL